MPHPRFTVFRSKNNNEFYFQLRASNNEIILSGEGYTSKQSCFEGVAAVKMNSNQDTRYERKDGPDNYTFNLKSPNGEIIGRSEKYNSRVARDHGIEAVRRDAPNASVEDLV